MCITAGSQFHSRIAIVKLPHLYPISKMLSSAMLIYFYIRISIGIIILDRVRIPPGSELHSMIEFYLHSVYI